MKAHLEIEMPTSCFDCPISHSAYYRTRTIACGITGKTVSAPECEEKRMESCPFVPVPEHGRLIDADKLFARVTDYYGTSYTIDMICEAPTIIPAEEA